MDTYTIKEVSEMFHLPSSTLRYYEDLGILTNVGRSNPASVSIYRDISTV